MRSTDSLSAPAVPAVRFGKLITNLARQAGYDLRQGGTGRARLAADTGMSISAIGRMLRGETLPQPQHMEPIARAVKADVITLLIAAGIISPNQGDGRSNRTVSSEAALSPEAACDAWGITSPMVRNMLIGTIEHAMQLQRDEDAQHDGTSGTPAGGAVAKG